MHLSSWLRCWKKSSKSIRSLSRRRAERQAEQLEARELLTVTGVLIGTELSVFADGSDSITVRQGAGGKVEVLSGTSSLNTIPSVQSSVLTKLRIEAGDGNNVISVSSLTAAQFPVLTSIVINGANGNDSITGSDAFAESMLGGDGNDTLFGGGGNDTLNAGDGNDLVTSGVGNDSLLGGNGADSIDAGTGDDTVNAGDGRDTVIGFDGNDSLDGGQGPDSVDGGIGNDMVFGSQGVDTLLGGTGDDSLFGGSENDSILGGDGNDAIGGNGGNDSLFGEAGNDAIVGGAGNNLMDGGAGNDYFMGDLGSDNILGGIGNDTAYGGGGTDSINGGGGNDLLRGNGGNDTINGGGDSDIINGDAGNDLIDSGDVSGPSIPALSITDFVVGAEGNAAGATIFAASTTAPVAGTSHDQIVSGDFDRDGDLDLATEQSVTFNNGAGVFSGPVAITTNATGFMDVGDVDGDGDLDIVAPIGGGDISVVLNNGNGTFGGPATYSFSGTIFSASSVKLGDFDRDGDLDAACVVGFSVSQVFILTNSGNGTFSSPVGYAAGTDGSSDVDVGDIDGDGDLDLFVTKDFFQTSVAVLRNQGNGTFSAATEYQVGSNPTSIAVGDLDGDNDLDFVTYAASGLTPIISVGLNNGSGTYATPVSYNGVNTAVFNNDVEIADVDRDGDNDVVGVKFGDSVELYLNNGNGQFPTAFLFPSPGGSFGTDLVLGDFNGDNNVDVAYARGLASTTVGLRFNTGIVPVTATVTVSLSFATTSNVTVDFTMGGGSATNGTDYSGFNGTATILAGQTTSTIAIPIIGDALPEPNENFLVTLSNPVNATIADAQGQVVITNDDTGGAAAQTLSVADVTVVEGNTGTTNAVFTVTLSAGATGPVTVDFATQDGSATAGLDYTATSGQLTFPVGTLTQTVTVPVTGDDINEAAETYFLNLLNPVGAVIVDSQARGTITDDDSAQPVLSPHDTLDGGVGNDTINGSIGNDLLRGGNDNDVLNGGDGNDTVLGGTGNDSLVGANGDDSLNGENGNDTLEGGAGADILTWGGSAPGNDILNDSSGYQTIVVQGDTNAETFTVSQTGTLLKVTEVFSSSSSSSITASGTVSSVIINGGLGNDVVNVQSLTNVLPLVLTINGDQGNDTINAAGVGLGNVLYRANGGDGNDTLTGSNSTDSLNGDAGDDSLIGNSGNDKLNGGEGVDTASGGDGNDSITGGSSDDSLLGGTGNDTISGDDGADYVDGLEDNDVLRGGAGDDTVVGGFGNDLGYGDDGNDVVLGAAGDDSLDGGVGNDTLRGHTGNDLIKGFDGDDSIQGNAGLDTIDGGDGNDSIEGGFGVDDLANNATGDIIAGGDGDDTIVGGEDADTLLGGDGDDVITGAASVDYLFGDDGDDLINGNGARDFFNGGEGTDTLDLMSSTYVEINDLTLQVSAAVQLALAKLNGF